MFQQKAKKWKETQKTRTHNEANIKKEHQVGDSGGIPFDPMITPLRVRDGGELATTSGRITFRHFLEFMDNFISNAESLSYIHQHRVKSQQQQYKYTKPHTMATTNIQQVRAPRAATDIKHVNLKCIFCNSNRHNSKHCDAKKHTERKQLF